MARVFIGQESDVKAKVTPDEIAALVEEMYNIQVSHWPRSLTGSMSSGILLNLQSKGLISLSAKPGKSNYFIRYAYTCSPVFIDNSGVELVFHDLKLVMACRNLYHQRYGGSGGVVPKIVEEK